MKDFILLIPHFNNPEGLITSLKSINYPTDKFEVLIVDDGSKTPLNEQSLRAALPNMPIKVVLLPVNVGVAKALNAGLKEIHKRSDYKYIARLDCGDTCNPERFIKQVKFMDEHPEIYLLGTWCSFTDSITHKSYIYKTQTEHKQIIKEMHFKCSFIHPTVMFRREILDTIGYYPENYPYTEDYAYFWMIVKLYKGALLPQNMVFVITNKNTISFRNRKEQLLWRKNIVSKMNNSILYKYMGLLYLNILSLLPTYMITKLKYIIKQ